METSEHIIEAYVRYCKNWFTNSNIKTKGGKEIDILAIDVHGNKYWIESGVTITGFKLIRKSKRSPHTTNQKTKRKYDKWIDKNGLDYFIEVKFKDASNLEKLNELGFKKYQKIIVCFEVGESEVHKEAKKQGIEIWELKKILHELIDKIGTTHYSDEILRTIQLVKKANNS